MRMILVCFSVALFWPTHVFANSDPRAIAKDFCHAVAAQALCPKFFTMDGSIEKRMELLVGGKLRGKTSPLNAACETGYNEFYNAQDTIGKAVSCKATLAMFGPTGNRRAGLLKPRAAPAMKMPEAKIAGIVKDFCTTSTIAETCPNISLSKGLKARLESQTGVKIGAKNKYFSQECGSGIFKASLAAGKVDLETFCAVSLDAYGENGLLRTGYLTSSQTVGASAGTAPVKAAKPAKQTPEARPSNTLVILTKVPDLLQGKTPVDVLGGTPGTLDAQGCKLEVAKIAKSHGRLVGSKNHAGQTINAMLYAADIKAAHALCPSIQPVKLPDEVLVGVINTGLDACQIVFDTLKTLNEMSSDYRKRKLYRGMFGISEAKLWALNSFASSCAKGTGYLMKSKLKYAKQNADRERASYTCRMWQNLFYEETKVIRTLSSDKRILDAIKHLDTRLAAVVHGQIKVCKDSRSIEYSKKQWLSLRKSLQMRL